MLALDVTLLRAALVVIAALNIGAMLSIGLIHWRAWRILPAGAGLLPLHVFLVALAVSGLQGTLTWAQLEALTGATAPATTGAIVRLGCYFLFSILLAAALGVMANLQYRRLTVGRGAPARRVEVTEGTVATIITDGDSAGIGEDPPPRAEKRL